MALTENGEIYTFGNTKDGKLGYDENNPNVYIPKKITNGPIFTRKGGMFNRKEKYPLFNQYDEYLNLIPEYNMSVGCEVVSVTVSLFLNFMILTS
jgi:hypothetical protein